LSPLRAFLRRHRRIALDTSIFICELERNIRYQPFTNGIFAWLGLPDSEAILSTVTMTELLVQPLREGNESVANQYDSVLTRHPNLNWSVPDLPVATLAAQFRANYRLKTIHALIATTAIHASATGLITNDSALTRVKGLDVLVLETLL
jgi:predicted nucleic acid-binding protein